MQDVASVIKRGRIEEEGEWRQEYGNWVFRIIGPDTDGKEFKLVLAYSGYSMVLISGMRKERGKWARD